MSTPTQSNQKKNYDEFSKLLSKDDPTNILCRLGPLNLGCIGCCSFDFSDRSIIKRDIGQNTLLFHEHKNSIDKIINKNKKSSRNRICYFVINFDNDTIGCALHPKQNAGEDLRKEHCGRDYLCQTNKEFSSWNFQTQMSFLDFIQQMDLDFIDYSIGIIQGNLLNEFKSNYSMS